MVVPAKLDLDEIDRRIVATLQGDGRLSNVELAERVGLSPSPCLRRVKRLEREGYIEAYRASLGRRRIGLGLTVFVGVKIEDHASERAGFVTLAMLTADGYRDLMASRPSPKSQGAPRQEEILLVDLASADQALVKLRVRVNATVFIDYLAYHRIEGAWRVTAKSFHIESSAAA